VQTPTSLAYVYYDQVMQLNWPLSTFSGVGKASSSKSRFFEFFVVVFEGVVVILKSHDYLLWASTSTSTNIGRLLTTLEDIVLYCSTT
jgi:hypothetical protein